MKKIGVVVGLLVIVLAGVLGYMYLKNQQVGERVMIVKYVSVVEPGLGLRALHEQGYTGRGVNVAIIGGPL